MRATISAHILLILCLACKNPKSGEIKSKSPEQTDSTEQHEVGANIPKAVQTSGKSYVIASEVPIYDPYDFALEIDAIKALLGKEIRIDIDYFKDEYSGERDALIKVTYEDTEIKFYQLQEGKHYANITTPKLSVLNGIKIGMPKQEFLTAMQIDGPKASAANTFVYTDDYGTMDFFFEDGALSLIKIYYEEGD